MITDKSIAKLATMAGHKPTDTTASPRWVTDKDTGRTRPWNPDRNLDHAFEAARAVHRMTFETLYDKPSVTVEYSLFDGRADITTDGQTYAEALCEALI